MSPRSRFRLTLTALAASSALALTGCTTAAAPTPPPSSEPASTGNGLAEMEPITLIYATALPETNIAGAAERDFMDYVEAATDGKVTFERYFAGSLVTSAEGLDAVQSGLADIAYGIPTIIADEIPMNAWSLGLGGLSGDDSASFGQIQKTLAYHQFLAEHPEFDAEYADIGVKPLTPFTQDNAGAACTDPVTTPEQSVGKSVSATPTWTPEIAEVGFTTTYLPLAEVYEGLQRGVIQCYFAPLGGIFSIKLYEVAPHFSAVGSTTALSLSRPYMNLDKWESLPAEVQEIFDEASLVAVRSFLTGDLAANAEIAAASEADDGSGFSILSAPEVAAVIDGVQERAVAALPGSAPAGIDDPEALIARYKELLEEWGGILDGLGATVVSDDEFLEGLLAGPDQPVAAAIDRLAGNIGLSID